MDHRNMLTTCNRPFNYEYKIMRGLKNVIQSDDILIHLGDVAWKNDMFWHQQLNRLNFSRKWLCLGNHDNRANQWYLDKGWCMICRTFTLKINGKKILFSHKPQRDNGYDINIHGHLHNTTHHDQDYAEPQMKDIRNDKQYLIAVEYLNYQPINIDTIIKRFDKGLRQ
jgi:calcineurin-like phosphoesterase family protein